MSSMRSASSSTRILTAFEVDQPALQVVAEPAGRGDDHLRAPADRVQLSGLAQTADHDGAADAGSVGKLGKVSSI